ncbi:MAG: hypothetical protein AB8B95_15545 [Pseudohongiellaceae bacterium]
MTNEQILSDLSYASQLAKEGASAPLVGGRIGLMWGCLLSVTLILQWAIMTQAIDLPLQSLLFVWFAFAVIGGTGSAVMGRETEKLDGSQSVSNRVEKHVWLTFCVMMATLFAGVLLDVLLFSGDTTLYNIIVIVAFAGHGFAYGVVGAVSGAKYLFAASIASFITAAICITVYNQDILYLIGGLACLITIVVPSLISLKNERENNV